VRHELLCHDCRVRFGNDAVGGSRLKAGPWGWSRRGRAFVCGHSLHGGPSFGYSLSPSPSSCSVRERGQRRCSAQSGSLRPPITGSSPRAIRPICPPRAVKHPVFRGEMMSIRFTGAKPTTTRRSP
jgi:hypothetical protein